VRSKCPDVWSTDSPPGFAFRMRKRFFAGARARAVDEKGGRRTFNHAFTSPPDTQHVRALPSDERIAQNVANIRVSDSAINCSTHRSTVGPDCVQHEWKMALRTRVNRSGVCARHSLIFDRHTNRQNRSARWRLWISRFESIAFAFLLNTVTVTDAAARELPRFFPELGWLHVPNGWAVGDLSAVTVDAHDNVWVLHRPRSIAAADRARAAPSILEFDRSGNFICGFGGPGDGYDWPSVEHSIAVDGKGRVWIAGNFRTPGSPGDDMLLTFTGDGHFLRQIGRRGASAGDTDTSNLHGPADIFVDDAVREVYVADGYANRRIIVFDSETGAFKRMWGAFGTVPPVGVAPLPRVEGVPAVPETGDGPRDFNGVHGVRLSKDGLVYVSDRNNQRIQVFTRAGKYVRQAFVDRNMRSGTTASGIAFSPDRRQRYLYVADFGNAHILVFERATLRLLETIGGPGTAPGEFRGAHLIATDSRGVIYIAEVQGRRLQRLVPDFNGKAASR
jgi:DNA-binding beta-propeller fold protein YncE